MRVQAQIDDVADDRDDLYPHQWIQTKTGRRVWPMHLRASDVAIEDIAHALAIENRFGGHTARGPYSVAQHSVIVSRLVLNETHDPLLAFAGLLHDATEAYVKDIPSPIKRALGDVYRDAEARAAAAIAEAFGLDDSLLSHPEVKRADLRDFADPPRFVKPSETEVRMWPAEVVPVEWTIAKRHFMERFVTLSAVVRGERFPFAVTPIDVQPLGRGRSA